MPARRLRRAALPASLLLAPLLLACDDDASGDGGADAAVATPVFPADFASRWTMLRDCRQSIEHELEHVRLYVPPDQAAAIDGCLPATGELPCTDPLPVGTTLVKAQYVDAACTDLARISAVRRETDEPVGTAEAWRWQEWSASGDVIEDGAAPSGCVGCHAGCDPGWDHRCVMDP